MFFKTKSNPILMDIYVPSIFFDIYIPIATGNQLKVYLLGYKSAQVSIRSDEENTNNRIIANMVGITEDEVVDCWKFWEEMGAIKIHKNRDDKNIQIEFLDIKDDFVNRRSTNSGSNTEKNDQGEETSDDKIDSSQFVNMYDEIEVISGRLLTPNEKLSILDAIESYSLETNLVVAAFEKAKSDSGKIKSVNYVIGILKSWYDNNVKTLEELEIFNCMSSELKSKYNQIFKSLGFFRSPTQAEEKIMNRWIEAYNMDMEIILFACSKSANISNPNLKYFDSIISDWHDNGLTSMEKVLESERIFEESKKSKKKVNQAKEKKSQNTSNQNGKKNKFHNYDQGISDKYTDDELNALIKKLNNQK